MKTRTKIKIAYPLIANMGDLLNPLIVENIFNVKVVSGNTLNSDLFGIGSGLKGLFFSNNIKRRLIQVGASMYKSKVHVWGTGFLNDEEKLPGLIRKNTYFHAVRGKLSKLKIEKKLNKSLDIPTGDGGILASLLINSANEKKYRIGIIPHFREQDHPLVNQIMEHYKDSKFINLKEDPLSVIQDISDCELILSSSLHGLIVADSFHIPNLHITLSDKLLGDGFKFKDYYSNYNNVNYAPIDFTKRAFPSYSDILEQYAVSKDEVEFMKQEIKRAFPFQE